ncbi:aquaporin-1 [Mollisia scopiformis]|uniref:Aquaporin-1 n=1 Tax=Mollisia scopiformis TaxID=149040 RepID=A0A194XUN0_MOLSC|nr:aquaporin-1 [Mollisia scopiformis]KUJ23918.1 aquaporin-1 [Mollisia scopiformis]
MPIPLAYKYERDGKYQPPVFEKTEPVPAKQRSEYVSWMSDGFRHHVIAMLAELVGTFLFLFFAFTAAQIANNKPDTLLRTNFLSDPSLLQLLYISLGFGGSLAVNAWIFYRISGGMFNPAVTLGLCLAGVFPWLRAVLLVVVQVGGGLAAAITVSALFPGPLMVQTKLGDDTTTAQGLFIEMLLTAELVFTILMLAVEKHKASFVAPACIGLTLFMGHLIGVNFTGAGMNPARSFGPAVVLGEFVPYHWIYWLGPVMGALLAVGFYKLLKLLEYETANPGQDDDGLDTYRLNKAMTEHKTGRVTDRQMNLK